MMIIEDDLRWNKIDEKEIATPRHRLGSGRFGRVFDSTYKDMPVAIKFMKHAINPVFFYNEMDILKDLQHENIPVFYGFVQTDTKLGIIMQKVDGISLFDYVCIHDVEYGDVLHIGRQIAQTLRYIHSKKILYRDLKPDNIMIHPSTLKIVFVDFGLAYQLITKTEKLHGLCGTPGFMAPEVLRGNPYGLSSDIYSFGMTMYVVSTSSDPCNPRKMRSRMMYIPSPLRDLIWECISPDPTRRPSIYNVECSLVEMISMPPVLSLFQQIFSCYACFSPKN